MRAVLDLAQGEALRRKARAVSPRHLFIALAAEDLMSEAERLSVGYRLLAPLELGLPEMRRALFPARTRLPHARFP